MKMTKMVCAAGLLACAGTLLSCMSTGTSNTKVERIEASQVQDLSGYWNDKDVQIVCEGLINECVASPRISQFSAKHNRAPIVKLGKITNNSVEKIDTVIVANKFCSAIINNGVMEFVASDDEVAAIRNERNQQEDYANPSTAAAQGNETGADYLLQGSIRTLVDEIDGKKTRTYYVNAELHDIETTKILWSSENSIRKFIKTK